MNYTAHLFLSGKNPEIIIGNILEDFVKGNLSHIRNAYIPEKIKIGIEMHRIIDTSTDTDADVKICKTFFYDDFGKYSPIIVDVLFDHFLLKNWSKFTDEKFEAFRPRVYQALSQYREIQPEYMIKLIDSMILHDWLKNYSEIWGLERAFLDLNNRIHRPDIDLRKAIPIFQKNYEELDHRFLLFFSKLKNICDDFLLKHGR